MAKNPSNGSPFMGAIEIGGVLLHMDILTEYFHCDIAACHGRCCHEGDAGAPVTPREILEIEEQLDDIWPRLTAGQQAVIDRQGVAYTDPEGDLVTSIIGGGDCAFRGPEGCLLCRRPMSCHLYPIRLKQMGAVTALNYHRWDICAPARRLGLERGVRVWQFLREPLIRRFGAAWYHDLEQAVEQLRAAGYEV